MARSVDFRRSNGQRDTRISFLVVPVAATGALDAQGIAMNEIGRRAIMADPDWRGGAYATEGVFPARGLSIARMVGMVTYHSKESMDLRFGRNWRPGLFLPRLRSDLRR